MNQLRQRYLDQPQQNIGSLFARAIETNRMNTNFFHEDVGLVCDLVHEKAKGRTRTIVGIAGPPASGKSTLAEAVVAALDEKGLSAVLMPMDGYHLDNALLDTRGLLSRKGAPETFDSIGFCEAVQGLADAQDDVLVPKFDRQTDISIANAIVISPATQVVVVEGNYLLLEKAPWASLKDVFDATVFVAPPTQVLQERLQQRWVAHGLDPDAALERALGNDIPNAQLVLRSSRPADLMLPQQD